MSSAPDQPIIAFESYLHWEQWLEQYHANSNGIWMRIAKRGAAAVSITYAEALDVALCYGWIDGQKNSYDEHSWLQKFTPRRSRSVWSKINTLHIERLTAAGRMKPGGQAQVDAAKRDGRWERAYSAQRDAEPPEDFMKALNKNKKAKAFFGTLTRRDIFPIVYRLQSAKKAETKERRMKEILKMLERGERFYP